MARATCLYLNVGHTVGRAPRTRAANEMRLRARDGRRGARRGASLDASEGREVVALTTPAPNARRDVNARGPRNEEFTPAAIPSRLVCFDRGVANESWRGGGGAREIRG